MQNQELDSKGPTINISEKDTHIPTNTKSTLKALQTIKIPKEVEIIIEQTFIAAVFILSDMLIVWLAGLAFSDTIKEISFVNLLYNGIKISSALIITIRYLSNCIIEVNKSKKNVALEFQNKEIRDHIK